MTTDESLMFHLTQGALRRWSLWNEDQLPPFALGEERKWILFQSWRNKPYKFVQDPRTGEQIQKLHPMSEFTSWPYWVVLDLLQYINYPQDYSSLLREPEALKQSIVEFCDMQYANHEQEQPSNLFS